MRIDQAIVSSNAGPYLEYWPYAKEAWERIGIVPTLICVGRPTVGLAGRVFELPLIEGVKPSLQGQLARLWAYKMLGGNCITSDIDMLPILRGYFVGNAAPHKETDIVSYCADGAKMCDGYEPMCYILANNLVMAALIRQRTWRDFVLELAERGGQGWFTDQWWLTTQLLAGYSSVRRLTRGWNYKSGCANSRLDRDGWFWSEAAIKNGVFVDAHLPRLTPENRPLIADLMSCLRRVKA